MDRFEQRFDLPFEYLVRADVEAGHHFFAVLCRIDRRLTDRGEQRLLTGRRSAGESAGRELGRVYLPGVERVHHVEAVLLYRLPLDHIFARVGEDVDAGRVVAGDRAAVRELVAQPADRRTARGTANELSRLPQLCDELAL